MRINDLTEGTVDALRSAGAYASDLVAPTVRLGVTGLQRSGKTVFTTALVHNLIAGGRLPFFRAVAEGRVRRAWLEAQPDDEVPRFDIERHLDRLYGTPPAWPDSTRRISQLRVTLEFVPGGFWSALVGVRKLHLDIVDYPGEWLLDLPLLGRDYADWSGEAIRASREPVRAHHGAAFNAFIATLDPGAPADEQAAMRGAELFRAYLTACRNDAQVFSGLSPGRFLMPGDLEGSPALTFMPLPVAADAPASKGSLGAMMARRYDSYRAHVVKPFFRDHFARLDRQVVLVDALSALNAGPAAVADLGRALEAVLASFRPGTNSWLSSVLGRRIDRIAFCATKADHLHHTSHDRLEAILGRLTQRAIQRAQFAGAQVRVLAIAAVRSTREAERRERGERLPLIVGVPMKGERVGTTLFDGEREVAFFPGDLPADPDRAIAAGIDPGEAAYRFLKFRPPRMTLLASEPCPPFAHIRLDRVLDFLIGDRMT